MLITVLLLCPVIPPAWGTDYYFSSSGDDRDTGTAPDHAWESLSQVNSLELNPGDRIFLEGGSRFTGPLTFENDRGSEDNPIVVTSYGESRATIEAGAGPGLVSHNTAGLIVFQIEVVGDGRDNNTGDGIIFYNDLADDVKLALVHLEDVEVSGFGKNGIGIGGWNGGSGFRNIKIINTVIHDNGMNGVITFAQQPHVHEQVYVGHVRSYRNSGLSEPMPNSGSGIVLGDVKYGIIEQSVAHDNGWLGDGGVGIWTYDSSHVIIQYNESFSNRTAGPTDGGGFDLDGGVTDSLMQHNYSHDNDGAGYLLCQYPNASHWSNNTVRYNVSVSDGRKNGYAGIHVWNGGSGLAGAEIHTNLVVMAPFAPGIAGALYFASETRRFIVYHNFFVTVDGTRLMVVAPGQADLHLIRNQCWFAGSNAIAREDWKNGTLVSLSGTTCW